MADLGERLRLTIGRHFVTLSCVRQPASSDERILVFSGFVVDIAGEWFYITAGHILRDLRHALETGVTFDVWRLGDQTAGHSFQNTGVPYAFDPEHWFVIENEELGLDYATVHLGGLYRLQLEAGGVIPFGPDAWSDHTIAHDHWALVGVPQDSVAYDGKTIITARIVLVPLVPTDPPELAGVRQENQFYAKLSDGSEGFISDLVGMSGGPIAMARYVEDEGWKYSIIGVQSGWYPNLRTIAACPIKSFTDALQPIVEEALGGERDPRGEQDAT
jgi:hypothetical protein